jgi:hypothetical protein
MRRMEEKSLKVYDTEKTFFSKISNTITKTFIYILCNITNILHLHHYKNKKETAK